MTHLELREYEQHTIVERLFQMGIARTDAIPAQDGDEARFNWTAFCGNVMSITASTCAALLVFQEQIRAAARSVPERGYPAREEVRRYFGWSASKVRVKEYVLEAVISLQLFSKTPEEVLCLFWRLTKKFADSLGHSVVHGYVRQAAIDGEMIFGDGIIGTDTVPEAECAERVAAIDRQNETYLIGM